MWCSKHRRPLPELPTRLTTGQKAAVAAELEPLYAAEAKERESARKRGEATHADLHESHAFERQSVSRAAKATGTSGRAVAQFKGRYGASVVGRATPSSLSRLAFQQTVPSQPTEWVGTADGLRANFWDGLGRPAGVRPAAVLAYAAL